MKICTITCHDVYNVGASLQAYALQAYLKSLGHDVRIIDYKPDYLSQHYRLDVVGNPKYDKPFLRQAYLLAKLPGRLRMLPRKKVFDDFTAKYLTLTKRYTSNEELTADPPVADVYFAGSDQIWNPLFRNGKDPAFYLNFVPEGMRRVSYAASFAVETLKKQDADRMKPWLEGFNAISVRESSGIALLANMGIKGIQVVDPVFLLPKEDWEKIAIQPSMEKYILVYDFDNSPTVKEIAKAISRLTGKKIVSLFPVDWADVVWANEGPLEFLGDVQNADIVLSNSFHATAFSLIFKKTFYVVNRTEQINSRMRDILNDLGLSERLIDKPPKQVVPVSYYAAELLLEKKVAVSKAYLDAQTQN